MVHDGVTIAYRDHGGDGPPIVLIPGAGRTLVDFEPMLPVLTERHRVVAMDLRGHGLSSDGPWGVDDVVGDVAAIVEEFGLRGASIAGHSLGGMIAALYGAQVGDCTAAVNIDGHGQGRPDQYVGFSTEVVTERMAELKRLSAAMQPAAKDLAADELAAVREALLGQLQAAGVPAEIAAAGLDRGVESLPDGKFRLRPTAEQTRDLLALVESLDLFAVYRRVRCPLLVYNATRVEAPQRDGVPEWLGPHIQAFRAGLSRDLEALAAERPNVSLLEVDATHALPLEQPAEVARQISDFVLAAASA